MVLFFSLYFHHHKDYHSRNLITPYFFIYNKKIPKIKRTLNNFKIIKVMFWQL